MEYKEKYKEQYEKALKQQNESRYKKDNVMDKEINRLLDEIQEKQEEISRVAFNSYDPDCSTIMILAAKQYCLLEQLKNIIDKEAAKHLHVNESNQTGLETNFEDDVITCPHIKYNMMIEKKNGEFFINTNHLEICLDNINIEETFDKGIIECNLVAKITVYKRNLQLIRSWVDFSCIKNKGQDWVIKHTLERAFPEIYSNEILSRVRMCIDQLEEDMNITDDGKFINKK